jgi:hypothetical protein
MQIKVMVTLNYSEGEFDVDQKASEMLEYFIEKARREEISIDNKLFLDYDFLTGKFSILDTITEEFFIQSYSIEEASAQLREWQEEESKRLVDQATGKKDKEKEEVSPITKVVVKHYSTIRTNLINSFGLDYEAVDQMLKGITTDGEITSKTRMQSILSIGYTKADRIHLFLEKFIEDIENEKEKKKAEKAKEKEVAAEETSEVVEPVIEVVEEVAETNEVNDEPPF